MHIYYPTILFQVHEHSPVLTKSRMSAHVCGQRSYSFGNKKDLKRTLLQR